MLKDGRLSAYKVGKEWRFEKNEVFKAMKGKNAISIASPGGGLNNRDREYANKLMEKESSIDKLFDE